MSKIFEATQKAQEWALREGQANKQDVQHALETVETAHPVADTLGNTRLSGCRKIKLPFDTGGPVLFAGNSLPAVATESYIALRTRLLRLQASQGFRSVVLSSPLPGEGKTLTTLNLALCCAQLSDVRILMIDADMRTHGLTNILGQPAGPGLGEVLAGQTQLENVILATERPNLYFLGAGSLSKPAPELYAGDRWRQLVSWCGENFQLVLVDSPPILPLADFEQIASGCDGVLVVVRGLKTHRDSLQKAARRIDPNKLLGAVFNSAGVENESHYRSYLNSNGAQK
jgi:capsular exopolysaccharide synthesis family protein